MVSPRKPYDKMIEDYIAECDNRLINDMRNTQQHFIDTSH